MKNPIKKLCIISDSYPTSTNPSSTFVHQLVSAWADMGIECIVISPNSISKNLFRRLEKKPSKWIKTTEQGNKIEIYSPKYISFSSKKIFGFNSIHLTIKTFKNTVIKELKKQNIKPDAIYAHFVIPSGITAAAIGDKFNIPSFFAFGESSDIFLDEVSKGNNKKILDNINGVVAVSSENRRRLLAKSIVRENKIKVFPNAIDNKLFRIMDKKEVRKKYGYDEDDFIIAFVGHYINRKGPLRLSNAINTLEGVKSIFIGEGTDRPTCKGILHTGKVEHKKIPEMLNAADIFVLPTLNEGCCNAIIEAMACGLPIVSSNLAFNDDILDETNSIRINPNNIDEISEAIANLKNDTVLRSKLSKGSLRKANELKIEVRALKILKFMEININKKSF